MHQGRVTRAIVFLCTVAIGFSLGDIKDVRAQNSEVESAPGLVEVEVSPLIPMDVAGGYYLIPYKYRRSRWGSIVGVGFGTFLPEEYEPNFYAQDFADVYGDQTYRMAEIQVYFKRNLDALSVGVDFGAGAYVATALSGFDSSITLYPVRLGAKVALDSFSAEPYIVPYAAAGAYVVVFTEEQAGNTFNGNTQPAPYFSGGVMFQTNWIDPDSARSSYQESGIENSYFFIEARLFSASGAAQDPDFSSLHFNAGMSVEF